MKKKNYGYYRRLRTHAERVANEKIREEGVYIKWGRARRNEGMLDPWNNEQMHGMQKSWKMKRQKQYHVDGRGQKHTVVLGPNVSWSKIWGFESYCRDHNIPYSLRRLHHLEHHVRYKKAVWTFIRNMPSTKLVKVDGKWQEVGCFQAVYDYVYTDLEEPQKYTTSITDGYEFSWWSKKDIGLKYLCLETELE
jgi:hypothetical protein